MESHHENNFSLEQQSQSTLVQSFWHGKSLQKAYKEGKPSPNSMNDKIASTRHHETSLSRNVHQLICESFEQLVAASTIRRIPSRECIFIRAELESLAIWRKVRRALGEGTTLLWEVRGGGSGVGGGSPMGLDSTERADQCDEDAHHTLKFL